MNVHNVRRERSAEALVVLGAVCLALLFGLTAGFLGFNAQLLLAMLVGAAAILIFNQMTGVILFILLVPYNGSEQIPRMAQNLVIFGLAALLVARMTLRVAGGKPLNLPMPRPLVFYVLLVTFAVAIGYTHLKEMTPYFMMRMSMDSYGFKEYVVGLYAKQMTLVLMAASIAWIIVNNGGRGKWAIYTALASGVMFVVLMLLILAASGFAFDRLRGRNFFMALGRQSNSAGGLLLILFACSLFSWEMARGASLRLLLLGSTMMLMLGVLLTASRGAVLGLVAALALYVIHFRRLRAAFAMVILAAIGFALAPDSVHERMLQGLDSRSIVSAAQGPGDEVTSGRIDIWSRLAPEVLRSPLIGRGLFSTQWSQYAKTGGYWAGHPHSMWLGILMDVGILGFGIMLLLYRYLWQTFRSLARDARLEPHVRGYFLGAWAALVSYLVYGVANGFWHPSPEQLYLWVAVGVAVGYRAWLGPEPVETAARRKRVFGLDVRREPVWQAR